MKKIKKGDVVVRKSYGKDIVFSVKRIIKQNSEDIAILCGLVERIEADSKFDDLEVLKMFEVKNILKKEEDKINQRIAKKNIKRNNRLAHNIITGKILHLDGDRRYSKKSSNYYRKLGLNAIVKNIPEHNQPQVVYRLLKAYEPDILVITGHDGMIKKDINYNDIYNYRNSRYFINTVKEARRYDKKNNKNTVIFARSLSKLF